MKQESRYFHQLQNFRSDKAHRTLLQVSQHCVHCKCSCDMYRGTAKLQMSLWYLVMGIMFYHSDWYSTSEGDDFVFSENIPCRSKLWDTELMAWSCVCSGRNRSTRPNKDGTDHSTCNLWSSSLHQQGLQASILCACDSFSIAQDLFACSGQSLLIAERTGAACLYLNLQNPWSIPFVCSMLTVPDWQVTRCKTGSDEWKQLHHSTTLILQWLQTLVKKSDRWLPKFILWRKAGWWCICRLLLSGWFDCCVLTGFLDLHTLEW